MLVSQTDDQLSQFSCSVMSDSLWPHGLQHARLPCPSPTLGAYSNLCPSKSVMSSNHLILCRPLLLPPSILPSIRVFSNESVLRLRWPKYWNFSFSISPSNEYSGLISFRIDWTPCSPRDSQESSWTPQFRSFSSLVLSLLIVQLSHPYMTTGKAIPLTRWTSVGKAMSLLFNMLSRLVIAFLPRSKHLLISWLQSPSAVILEPPKIKSLTVSIVWVKCFG